MFGNTVSILQRFRDITTFFPSDAMLSSVRPSITRWYYTKATKGKITKTTSHGSPGSGKDFSFSGARNLGEIPTDLFPTGAPSRVR